MPKSRACARGGSRPTAGETSVRREKDPHVLRREERYHRNTQSGLRSALNISGGTYEQGTQVLHRVAVHWETQRRWKAMGRMRHT